MTGISLSAQRKHGFTYSIDTHASIKEYLGISESPLGNLRSKMIELVFRFYGKMNMSKILAAPPSG